MEFLQHYGKPPKCIFDVLRFEFVTVKQCELKKTLSVLKCNLVWGTACVLSYIDVVSFCSMWTLIDTIGRGNDYVQFKLSHKSVVAGLNCRWQYNKRNFTYWVLCVGLLCVHFVHFSSIVTSYCLYHEDISPSEPLQSQNNTNKLSIIETPNKWKSGANEKLVTHIHLSRK